MWCLKVISIHTENLKMSNMKLVSMRISDACCMCIHVYLWIELFWNRCQCVWLSKHYKRRQTGHLMGEWQTFNLYLYWLNWICIAAAVRKPECLVFTVICCMDGHACMHACDSVNSHRFSCCDIVCRQSVNSRLDDHPFDAASKKFRSFTTN